MRENANITGIEMFRDLDQIFKILEDTRINYNTFKGENLGVVLCSEVTENADIFVDTTLEDLLSLDKNYQIKCITIDSRYNLPVFTSIAPAKKSDFRGEVNYLPKNTIRFTTTTFINGEARADECLPIVEELGLKYDCPLTILNQRCSKKEKNEILKNHYEMAHMNICFAWEDYFKWKIRVKMPEWNKSVDFYINPCNIKEVFRLRDIVDGQQRRKALKHIVRSHTRRISESERIEIVRHLRGEEKFKQNGYEITIIPSKDDLKRIK